MRLHPLIVVTGSRQCESRPVLTILDDTLDEIEGSYGMPLLLQGGAPGADAAAAAWGYRQMREHRIFYVETSAAPWTILGKPAGPIRNAAMTERAWAHQQAGGLVIMLAFPLGISIGTRNMIQACERAGINDIRTYEQETP